MNLILIESDWTRFSCCEIILHLHAQYKASAACVQSERFLDAHDGRQVARPVRALGFGTGSLARTKTHLFDDPGAQFAGGARSPRSHGPPRSVKHAHRHTDKEEIKMIRLLPLSACRTRRPLRAARVAAHLLILPAGRF